MEEIRTSTPPSRAITWDGGEVCFTLTANNAGGNQRMPDKDNFSCIIVIADDDS